MDFTGVPFSTGSENILDFDGNGPYAEDAPYGDLFRGDVTNESFATVAESFSGNESYTTTTDYPPEPQEESFQNESGEFRESSVILVDGSDQFGVSTAVFDSKEELIWSGNQGGHVTSYLSADMMKYTSFQVHQSEEIRDLRSIDSGILCLTPTTFNLRTRQGIPVFTQRSENFENLQCMLPFDDFSNRVLIGGHQESLIEIDLNQPDVNKEHNVGEHGCVILREHPRFVCHGNTTGGIILHDPRSMRPEHSFQAHSGALSDFDVQGNYIITCGFANRMGQLMGDQFVMVFDMRMMKMSLPLRAMVPPYFTRFMPGLSSCLAAVSLLGQWLVLDAAQPENTLLAMNYQVSCSPDSVVTSFDISSSSQALVFGDSLGSLHLFTTGSKPAFNNFSQETILPVVEEHTQHIPLTDVTTSFSSVHLDYTDEPLLSDWPYECMLNRYWPTQTIDPQILQSMRMVGSVGYAPNTLNRKRNQFPYTKNGSGSLPQFVECQNARNDEGSVIHVPRRYRRIELKYNKMGVDEFDFDSYNRTNFAGLDMSLPNSYCNSVLQIFYYIAPLRGVLMSHLCEREFCLACELGFLFHMLDVGGSQGTPCHASNFLRAFRTIPEASAMSLTISDQDNRARINFASKIQSWSCFVLQQIHSEVMEGKEKDILGGALKDMPSFGMEYPYCPELYDSPKLELQEKCESSPVSDIFGAQTISINKCTRCDNQTEKDVMTLTVNLSFHESASELSQGSVSFATVVQNSLCLRQTTQAWCDSCAKYQPMEQFRRFKSLPSAIAMNCGLDSPQDLKFWKDQHKYLLLAVHDKLKDDSEESASDAASVTSTTSTTATTNTTNSNAATTNTTSNATTTSTSTNTSTTTSTSITTTTTNSTAATSNNSTSSNNSNTSTNTTTITTIITTTASTTSTTSTCTTSTTTTAAAATSVATKDEDSGSASEGPPLDFPNSPSKSSKVRSCRYSTSCVRPGCKFWHPMRKDDDCDSLILGLLDQTMEYAWVPEGLWAQLNEDGTITMSDVSKEEFTTAKDDENRIIYDLVGVVSHVSDPKFPDKNNLTACIKVGPSYHQRAKVSPVSHWYLFNDISIIPITSDEAVWFPCGWKIPCVLYWVRRTLPESLAGVEPVNPITIDAFGEDKSLAQRGRKRITFTPLTSDEMPGEGDLIAMDAEFVNLHQEEAEIRSDGTRTTIKPSQKSVGRITCIRGFGPLQGTPFLDDYISTQEQVVDYLTQFSGIKPGDLDANYSQKHLTTLKSTYIKLRHLVDTGVKIVGHGLKNDLRVINLVVPQSQLIDTVHLFHLPHNRMVSLKFLAWYFLKVKIQSVMHDSIEDARTALALYHKYLEIKSSGSVVVELQKMYDAGKKLLWKVPGEKEDELQVLQPEF